MVKQYPYTLKVLTQGEAVFEQETAEWVPGAEHWQDWCKCRDEVPNALNNVSVIPREDGEYYQIAAVIYCPKDIERIDQGAKIQVWQGEEIRIAGVVRRFSKDQFNARVWI